MYCNIFDTNVLFVQRFIFPLIHVFNHSGKQCVRRKIIFHITLILFYIFTFIFLYSFYIYIFTDFLERERERINEIYV